VDKDSQRIAETLAGWGVAVPRGAWPALAAICQEMRGEARLPAKALAEALGWSEWKLAQLRQYGRQTGDNPFVAGEATVNEIRAWLARHPEWRSGWRKRPQFSTDSEVASTA
jgi:hypothetical protein